MFGLEERSGAVELYFTTSMTTAKVVVHLEYPTRRCLERWLAADPRYAGRMAKPITPLGTRRKATVPHRELKAIGEADMLVIDELGYLPIDIDGAKLLCQIIADSHERRSIILRLESRVRPVGRRFRRPRSSTASTRHGRIIRFHGESYRNTHSLMK